MGVETSANRTSAGAWLVRVVRENAFEYPGRRRLARTRRRPGYTGLRQCCPDLLHPVDELDRRGGRQYEAASRITAAGNRRIGLDLVEAGYGEFDPQRLTVEDETADGIGESLGNLRTIHMADRRRLALALHVR